MSVTVRLISGSAAGWVRIGLTMASQFILVPVYLSYWDTETYGAWLAIQGLVTLVFQPDLAHQMYVGFELLRSARKDMLTFCKFFWSALMVGVLSSLLVLLAVVGLSYSDFIPWILGESDSISPNLAQMLGGALFLQSLTWVLTSSIGGFMTRSLEPFGYIARLAWWGVAHLIVSSSTPAIAVILGADLYQASLILTIMSVIFYIPIYVDMFRLMKKEGIVLLKPSWSVGFRNYMRSMALTGRLLLDNARQQGVRLVLAPLSGAVKLAAFSTMRTGANVALQGLNTITNPLMPDLMRFVHDRDQTRTEAGFGTIWIVVVALIAPAIIALQAIAGPLFELWTKNRIEFDPVLFSLLSLAVVIYALAQPAIAVVMGNNLMRPQLILSAVSATIVVGGLIVLIPVFDLPGAGLALVLAEIVVTVGYVRTAKHWLNRNGLAWPTASFNRAVTAAGIATVSMATMVLVPSLHWVACGIGIALCGWNALKYWRMLPNIVRNRFYHVVRTFVQSVRG